MPMNGHPVTPLLTEQRRRILDTVRDFYRDHGFAPTVRELATETGLAVSSVQHQLVQLQRMGWIRRHPSRSRALVVLNPTMGGE